MLWYYPKTVVAFCGVNAHAKVYCFCFTDIDMSKYVLFNVRKSGLEESTGRTKQHNLHASTQSLLSTVLKKDR